MNRSTFAALALSLVASMTAACSSSTTPSKSPAPSPSAEPAVAQVVSSMRRDLNACFEEGKKLNPSLHGGFVAEVKVGAAGSVESIDAQDVEGLNRNVIGCMTKRMQSARFPAPGEKGATVRIPLHFSV